MVSHQNESASIQAWKQENSKLSSMPSLDEPSASELFVHSDRSCRPQKISVIELDSQMINVLDQSQKSSDLEAINVNDQEVENYEEEASASPRICLNKGDTPNWEGNTQEYLEQSHLE